MDYLWIGDCCLDVIWDTYCQECICHETGVKHPTLSTEGPIGEHETTWNNGTTTGIGSGTTSNVGGSPTNGGNSGPGTNQVEGSSTGNTSPIEQDYNVNNPEETTKSTKCDNCNSSNLKTPCTLLILILSILCILKSKYCVWIKICSNGSKWNVWI